MNDRLLKESDVMRAIDKRVEELWDDPVFIRKKGYIDVLGVKKHILTIPSGDRQQRECLKEAEILLKATRNLLNKQNESIYVLNMLAETVTYYGVECDGSCLIEDIDAWMELYGSEEGTDDERHDDARRCDKHE